MTFNTNRTARKLRKHLGQPPQYTHSPWQWGYVEAVHAPRTTTLSSGAPAGASSIITAASVEANAMIVVGSGGPVQVESVTGTGPFTLTLAARGVPIAQSSGATVRVLATVDVYLDGWQNPPENLPSGVTQTLTTGVRYLSDFSPTPGQTVLIARGTGLQRSDRVVLGNPATGLWTSLPRINGWTNVGGNDAPARYRKVGGTVFIQGHVQGGSAFIVGSVPKTFVPSKNIQFATPIVAGGTSQAGFLIVDLLGEIWLSTYGGAVPTSGWIDCSFPADQ